jgi:hypothetical protein
MLETMEKRSELGGTIDAKDVWSRRMTGGKGSIDPHCKAGFVADWHSHPPSKVLATPVEDIYFLPPSEPDVYTALVNATLERNRFSLVLSIEGIYLIYISDLAIEQFKQDLDHAGVDVKENEYLRNCDFVLRFEGDDERGAIGFEPDDDLPWTSKLLAQRTTYEIMQNATTLSSAWGTYERFFAKFGIEIIWKAPVENMPDREVVRAWIQEKPPSQDWKTFLEAYRV